MGCEKYKPLIQEYLDGDMPVEKKPAVEKHIKECEACRQEFAEHERIAKMLSSLEDLPVPEDFLQNVRAKLEVKQSIWQKFTVFFRKPMPLQHSFGVIAIVVLFLGFFIWANLQTMQKISQSPSPNDALENEKVAMKTRENTDAYGDSASMPTGTAGDINTPNFGEKESGVDKILQSKSIATSKSYENGKSEGGGSGLLRGGSPSESVSKDELTINEVNGKIKEDASEPEKDTPPMGGYDAIGKIGREEKKTMTAVAKKETETAKEAEKQSPMLGTSGKPDDSDGKTTDIALEKEAEENKEITQTKGKGLSTGISLDNKLKDDVERDTIKDTDSESMFYQIDGLKSEDIESARRIIVPIKNYEQDIKALKAIIEKEKASIISSAKKKAESETESQEISAMVVKVNSDNLDSLIKKISGYNREDEKATKSVKTSIATQKTITVIITGEKP